MKREVWAVEFRFSPTTDAEPVQVWLRQSQALAYRNQLDGGPDGKHFVTKYVPEETSKAERAAKALELTELLGDIDCTKKQEAFNLKLLKELLVPLMVEGGL